jgi:hypothetical protein
MAFYERLGYFPLTDAEENETIWCAPTKSAPAIRVSYAILRASLQYFERRQSRAEERRPAGRTRVAIARWVVEPFPAYPRAGESSRCRFVSSYTSSVILRTNYTKRPDDSTAYG